MQDVVLEVRIEERKFRYRPYELYQEACVYNDFVGVIFKFLEKIDKVMEQTEV